MIGILIFVSAFAGGNSSPKSNESNTSEKDTVKTEFSVGETATLNDVSVTLVDVSENNGGNYMTPDSGNVFIVCEFEIENNSDDDIAVSSLMSFKAYVDDYSTSISLSGMLSTSKSQLDGTIAPGKKMNGVVGYEVSSDWSNLEIHYTPNFWHGKEMKFIYTK